MRKTGNLAREQPVAVVGSSSFGRYQKISSAKTYNMFISDEWLINTAGYQKILEILPQGQGRGFFVSTRGNLIVAVINSFVYSISTNFVVTPIGNLNTQFGEVTIDENLNSQICIVDGLNAWIYNYVSGPFITLQTISGTLIPNYVEYINTYFMFGNANLSTNGAAWYIYEFSTPTTITQVLNGQFALQSKPDFALAVVRLPGQSSNVLVFGKTVTEVWTNVGGIPKFRKNSTINIDYGVASVSTIARSDTYVAWLGVNENNSPVIMVYTGQGATALSTDGIDYQLSQIQFPAQSTAMMYRQDGHLFYQLTFFNPADNLTILYDFNTQKFFNLTDFNVDYHPAREYILFQGDIYFISLKNGSIYQSSTDFTTYNENVQAAAIQDPTLNLEIPRTRIIETYRSENSEQFRVNSFEFTMEQGNDINVTPISLLGNEDLLITEDQFLPPDDIIITEVGIPIGDEDSGAGIGLGDLPIPYRPRVDMTISRDGGITWSNTVKRDLNPIGVRQNIINWENMGSCNSITIKLRFWGTSRFVVYNGMMQIY